MRKDINEYYHALGLSPGASPAEIKLAYRQLIQRWHPDHFKSGTFMQTTAEDLTKEINEAYEQLFKKQLYKKYVARASVTRPATRSPFPPPPGAHPKTEESAQKSKKGGAEKAPGTNAGGRPRRRTDRLNLFRFLMRKVWRRVALVGIGALACAVIAGAIYLSKAKVSRPTDSPSNRREEKGASTPAKEENFKTESEPSRLSEAKSAAEVRPVKKESLDREGSAGAARGSLIGGGLVRASEGPTSGSGGILSFVERGSGARAAVSTESGRGAGGVSREFGYSARTAVADNRGLADSADLARLFTAASTLLTNFQRGDPKARVVVVQGVADEAGEGVFRYGSSLVYFHDGLVSGWVDRLPRLKVRAMPGIDFDLLETFGRGSARADVLRLQGRPDDFMWGAFLYGSSVVYFESERVSRWTDGSTSLRTPLIPSL